jgi:alpha-mannosidase
MFSCSYATGPNAYWTGFFTSRPALKAYVRDCSSVYNAARQLQVVVIVTNFERG